jgi:hypothetical protein
MNLYRNGTGTCINESRSGQWILIGLFCLLLFTYAIYECKSQQQSRNISELEYIHYFDIFVPKDTLILLS